MYFSRTFKALNFDFQIQGLSRTFKVRANLVVVNSVKLHLTAFKQKNQIRPIYHAEMSANAKLHTVYM